MILFDNKKALFQGGLLLCYKFFQNLFLFNFLNFISLYQLIKFTLRIKKNY